MEILHNRGEHGDCSADRHGRRQRKLMDDIFLRKLHTGQQKNAGYSISSTRDNILKAEQDASGVNLLHGPISGDIVPSGADELQSKRQRILASTDLHFSWAALEERNDAGVEE